MAFKIYDYDFTEIAEADIDETLYYISNELCNPKAAKDFVDELDDKLADICKSPKNGRLVVNEFLKRDDVRRFLVDNYIAYYIIDEANSKIVVLRVVYSKRNQNEILKNL
ncbi:type II toxin-antitoxin system RelE/ParE family toxin [Pseudobutyrivibrio xylanivorans]|uniref:Type II toxin-antitoxin system RelE/ParE family toxin n=1 Tax=Pseudobutyrivibrio xylanivorans TaxID=185007 RepID=A0A5P6VUZ1_PSEXY|nr:type II toxin-antitoxin system RelE/ParE family toxin [Pseudobutyrivibrio xylanivorans]QFJ56078.1 type II toxin-antitoxin system RelE/ParE family toxin [Pseudobutyrivibrio xylanivorans]